METLPRRVWGAFARFSRDPWRGRRARCGLLLTMVALILFMPMSYRAGTAFSHPHAFFQVFIDTATGHSHHDAGEQVAGAQAGNHAPDTPTLSALTAPLEQATSIPALSLTVLLLLAADRQRAIWALTRVPRGATPAPELPPPRRFPH